MRQIRVCHLLLLPAVLLFSSCNVRENPQPKSQEVGSVPQNVSSPSPVAQKSSKPVPPLTLEEPPELPGKLNDIDFEHMEAGELFMMGRAAAAKEIYYVAAMAQYWYFRKTDRGHYDVACYLARAGEIDHAFYWLQKAAIEEGVDTQHAQRDPDLESLRSDKRWKQVFTYMVECNVYFETADIAQTVLILPKDYKKPAAIPAVVWMHGLGARPNDFVSEESQEYADRLNVALIGVSGTKPRGPRSFVWAEDVERDAKRIRAALAEVSDRVTIEKGKVITFGFSQGAQVGLEVAAQFPEEFAGSIVLSPGADSHLQSIKPSSLLAQRGFVVSCGADEHPGNVHLAKSANDWLRRANAHVNYKPYAGVSDHSFPADFNERFPEWVEFILSVK